MFQLLNFVIYIKNHYFFYQEDYFRNDFNIKYLLMKINTQK